MKNPEFIIANHHPINHHPTQIRVTIKKEPEFKINKLPTSGFGFRTILSP